MKTFFLQNVIRESLANLRLRITTQPKFVTVEKTDGIFTKRILITLSTGYFLCGVGEG